LAVFFTVLLVRLKQNYAPITNLVNKSFAAFVTGQKDIDKDWDAYDKSSSNPNNV
jgi:hypothetical protein